MKCPECGKRGFTAGSGLGAHRRTLHGVKGKWRLNHKAKKVSRAISGNGHADLLTMKENGLKYLASRREVLLSQVDDIDAAMKALNL